MTIVANSRTILGMRLLAIVGTFALFWFNLLNLPFSPVTPEIDSSWCGALIHFSAQGLQYGKDIIFTYGPLSHLMSFVYTGELFTARVIWEFLSKSAFAAILTVTVIHLPRLWRVPFALFVAFFIWADPIADALHFLIFTCVAMALFKGAERPHVIVLAALLLAICSLFKFTYFLLAVVLVGLVIAHFCFHRKLVAAAILATSFAASFLFAWHLAGQNFGNLPAYIRMSWEICIGYKEAMAYPAASNAVVVLGLSAVILSFGLCAYIFFERPAWRVLCAPVFISGSLYLSWNRAFVRADDHVLSFFALCPVSLLVLWLVAEVNPRTRRIGFTVNAIVFALCLAGLWIQRPAVITNGLVDARDRLRWAWEGLTDTGGVKRQLDKKLAVARSEYALPRVQAEVRDDTIDVLGYQQGIAILNQFNYTPRLVFQSYSAYTPALIDANTAFYASAHQPAYVLMKLQPIDERYSTSEDAGVLRHVLNGYRFLFQENEYLLWKKVRSSSLPALDSQTQIGRMGEEIRLPVAESLWIELDVRASFRGKLRATLYKPPEVQICTTDSTGKNICRRLIPSMARRGFLLSPAIADADELIATAAGENSRSVHSLLIRVAKNDRRFFEKEFTYRIAQLPSPTPPRPSGAGSGASTSVFTLVE
jgi:hypothetical protein